jgi:ABC-type Zn uptake system ZnuABC Zn-binding protein ZnuA
MLKRTRTIAALSLLSLLLLAACGGAEPTLQGGAPAGQQPTTTAPTTGEKLKIVATFSILGDLAQRIGGDAIELRTLVGPGSDTHTFQPSPADGVALAEAGLVIENGLEFETWLDDLYAASGSKAQRVVVTAGIEPIEAEEGTQHEDDEHAAEAGTDEHGELDPHVWHDVANAMRMVEAIRDGLAQADPARAATYTANAEAYLAELKALDAFVVEQTGGLPEARRKLVTSHDTFAYFAKRYGFEIVGTALGASTEAADPSAQGIVELVERIRAAGVPAIFAENVQNPALMEQIASESGVALGPPLYTDALGEPGSDGDTYVKMIRSNVTAIVQALR